MPYQTLISAAELARELDNRNWVIFDCRFNLKGPQVGWQSYQCGHLPGARYAHLEHDLSGRVTPETCRHPLPVPQQLTKKLSAWGVDLTKQVVAYDDASGAIAGRLWWLLRWLGHEAVAVLDGGLQQWQQEGHPLTTTLPEPSPTHFEAQIRPMMAVTAEDVEHASLFGYVLLDARTAERFRGELEIIDPVAGHIPGAKNHPYLKNLDNRGRFLTPEALAFTFQKQIGKTPPEKIVCMCGSGVTACHNLLALEHAGLRGARLYPGSWSEWITDRTRPIATGDEVHD
jgi:thiosulfate/3-mercaptopyruvate sulfurtransferase